MALSVTAHSSLVSAFIDHDPFPLSSPGRRSINTAMANPKILLVEDDQDVLHSMHVRLKANNYDVAFASDAISCMAEARKLEPDLIILALGLPAGDGFMLMQRFKQIPSLAHVPVIVVTGQ